MLKQQDAVAMEGVLDTPRVGKGGGGGGGFLNHQSPYL